MTRLLAMMRLLAVALLLIQGCYATTSPTMGGDAKPEWVDGDCYTGLKVKDMLCGKGSAQAKAEIAGRELAMASAVSDVVRQIEDTVERAAEGKVSVNAQTTGGGVYGSGSAQGSVATSPVTGLGAAAAGKMDATALLSKEDVRQSVDRQVKGISKTRLMGLREIGFWRDTQTGMSHMRVIVPLAVARPISS